MEQIQPKDLVCALVACMKQEGVAPTRTRLVKFLYLADLHWARYSGGRPATGWLWTVDKFGPLATEALRLIDRGVAEGWLLQQTSSYAPREADEDRPQACIYDLPRTPSSPPALPARMGKVRAWIKQYGDSTPRLLRFVYGSTEPMMAAKPGDQLDFSLALPFETTGVPSSPIPRKQRKKLDELVRKLADEYASNRAAAEQSSDGPLDSAYFDGLPVEEPLTPGEVLLQFDREGHG